VATVSKTGKVTAKKAGKAKITVTSKKGKNYTCTVTVKSAAPVAPDKAILGVETNGVVLAYNILNSNEEHVIHLKVKDNSIDYATWSKSFKAKLADGATAALVADPDSDDEYNGYRFTHGILTVKSGGKTLDYIVEAFQESSGMYELTL
jgi:N-acetyl-beta-hexosaminidase